MLSILEFMFVLHSDTQSKQLILCPVSPGFCLRDHSSRLLVTILLSHKDHPMSLVNGFVVFALTVLGRTANRAEMLLLENAIH